MGVPKNYRPVALTSHLVKVFEKVIRAKLVNFLESNSAMNKNQHGFRSGRSCLSQLLEHHEQIVKGLEAGGNVDVIYLDFAKAFDKVDFSVLLKKLDKLGVRGKVGRWIKSFLTDRTQRVVVNGVKSKSTAVRSGVPQGSVLGPVLFLVLISDIDSDILEAFVSSFADDTRVGKIIRDEDDCKILQDVLEKIYEWAEVNNMLFNSDKFECLRYGTREDLKALPYKANNGQQISEKESLRDLGVTVDSDGSFASHIDKIVIKSRQIVAWVLRTFTSRSAETLSVLWKSLILPHLDYCCQLWCPRKAGKIQKLESVQQAFTRRIHGMTEINYWERLKVLKMYSLERRRERYIVMYTWKMIENLVPNVGIETKYNNRLGRMCKLPQLNCRGNTRAKGMRESSIRTYGAELFNALPKHLRNITNCDLNHFKRQLDGWLSLVPDEPLVPGYTSYRRADSNSITDMAKFVAKFV